MRQTTFTITVSRLFSPTSALSAESKPFTATLRLNAQVTLQIIASNFIILN